MEKKLDRGHLADRRDTGQKRRQAAVKWVIREPTSMCGRPAGSEPSTDRPLRKDGGVRNANAVGHVAEQRGESTAAIQGHKVGGGLDIEL